MTTIETKMREPVLKQVREPAAPENIPLDQLISLAVTQAVGVCASAELNCTTFFKLSDYPRMRIATRS